MCHEPLLWRGSWAGASISCPRHFFCRVGRCDRTPSLGCPPGRTDFSFSSRRMPMTQAAISSYQPIVWWRSAPRSPCEIVANPGAAVKMCPMLSGARQRRARFCRRYFWRGTRFFVGLSWIRGTPLALAPQRTGNHQRIYLTGLPPLSFLCRVM